MTQYLFVIELSKNNILFRVKLTINSFLKLLKDNLEIKK